MNVADEEKGNIFNKNDIYWSLILIICVFIVCIPLLSLKTTLGDDLYFHLSRIEGIKDGLLAGQFPVRVHAYQFNGYGYLCGVFYPDIFLYIPAGLRLLGVQPNLAYNVFGVLIQMVTAFFSWHAFRLVTDRLTGAVSSILYLSFWYHLYDIYGRAALGEVIAMAFVPLAIAYAIQLFAKDYNKWPLAVLSVSCVLQAHILSSAYLLFICIGVFLISLRKKYSHERKLAVVKTVFFVVMVNLWYYLPFIYYYTSVDFIMKSSFHSIESAGVPLRRFLYLLISFGIPSLIYGAVFVVEYFKRFKFIRKDYKKNIHWGLLIVFLLMFASTNKFPWHLFETIPVIGIFVTALQFPWRLQEFAAIIIALFGGIGLVWFMRKFKHNQIILGAVSVFICVFSIVCFYHPKLFLFGSDMSSVGAPKLWRGIQIEEVQLPSYGNQDIKRIAPDYLYRDMNVDNLKNEIPLNKEYPGIGTINMVKNGTTIKLRYSLVHSVVIEIPLLYYEGYVARDYTGTQVELTDGKNHIMEVILPAGNGEIKIWFQGLWYFRFLDFLSLFGFIFLCGIIIKNRKIRLEMEGSHL